MFFEEKYQKYINLISLLFFVVLVFSYGYYLINIIDLGEYYPSRSDEMGYFLEAKGFAETWSLAPYISQDEMIAPLFDLGTHGPMYALSHGMIAKIFGLHGLNFVLMNFAFLFGYFWLIWKREDFDFSQKLALFLIQFGYYITFFFTFAFNQELIHIFFGTALTLHLISLYKKNEKLDKLDWKSIFVFIAMLLMVTLYRYGWVLASVAIIPLAKNKKDFLKLCVVTFIILVIGQLYRKYFHASTDATLLQNVPTHVLTGNSDAVFSEMSRNISINLQYFFVSIYKYANYYYSKLLYFALACLLLYIGVKKKDKLCLAGAFIGWSHFLALIILYNAYDYRETRGLAASLAMMVIIMVYRKFKIATTVFAIYTILSFPFMFKEFNWLIFSKELASTKLYKEKKFRDLSFFGQLPVREGRDMVTVLFPEKLFWTVTPGIAQPSIKDILHTPLLSLPTKNFQGYRMRYTFNRYDIDDTYKQQGRFPIDYVLIPGKGIVVNSDEVKALAKTPLPSL